MALYNPPPNMIDGLTVPIPPLPSPISSTENTVTQVSSSISQGGRVHVNNVRFKAKPGYYYSKVPVANLNFPGGESYIVTTISELKNEYGRVVEKELEIYYNSNGFDVFEDDGHNITFIHEMAKGIDSSTKVKEIRNLSVDISSVNSNGESRNISISGTPGSIFSLTIEDKNGRNILPYSNNVSKTVKTAVGASNTLELNDASGLEVGMVVLNSQKRNVKITGISDSASTNVDAINEASTTNITISSHLTFSADALISFAKETELTEITIPDSGVYSFIQNFPALEKFKRTLKTAATSATSLTLDYTKDLEEGMRISGTGVDGNNPTISTDTGVNPDGVTIRVSDSQTIADETELTFEMPDNRYDITIHPINALIGDDIPKYSSDDCDVLPAYSIYQYIDPIIQFVPSSGISNVTVDGTVTLTGKTNRNSSGTSGDITINMTATKSDGNLAKSRNPLFSDIDSTVSDFSNTLNIITKTIREGDKYCRDTDIVHLNNTTGIRAGMIITGSDINTNKTITVKSITGTAVKFSEKQTVNKGDTLTFSSMFRINISDLTATLSANGGLTTGICTVTGTGKIITFGVDSFTSTFNFDDFLSAAE